MIPIIPSLPPLLDIDGILATRRPPIGGGPNEDDDERKGARADVAGRILVVEDDWFAGMDMEAALQEAGHDVLDVVVSADEAVEAARDGSPDLIIMDIRLVGNRDGVDAAIEIRRRFDIPCLFVTAYGDEELRSRAEPSRPAGWLIKPVSRAALVAAVKASLLPK